MYIEHGGCLLVQADCGPVPETHPLGDHLQALHRVDAAFLQLLHSRSKSETGSNGALLQGWLQAQSDQESPTQQLRGSLSLL